MQATANHPVPSHHGGVAAEVRGDVATTLSEIRAGLSRPLKELPSKLFYDERGSRLFEEITRLPEYYLTRAEHVLLEEHVPAWIAKHAPRSLVELGAGSAAKTQLILNAMLAGDAAATYVPVDISADFLAATARRLRTRYAGLSVAPLAADFTGTFTLPHDLPRPVLLTILGSTIGNFAEAEAVQLLSRIRAIMRASDRFLLGVDLRKEPAVLEAAYNDSRGVTAEFNLNMLRVLNGRFGAGFDLDGFRHHAFYDRRMHRVEMRLVSVRGQRVHFPGVGDIVLAAGESIRTEISCKYDRPGVNGMLAQAGLELTDWREAPGARFALVLASPAPPHANPHHQPDRASR